ncbi:MAG: hypothetical protein JRH01_19250 [Deltaproteobacteria bacterium]|nr:hypothetical protein [Deltaproteobacteria bacterium]MBW2393417.1 hypothetical protein [Deltaproteobacteria bacterium]
MASESASKHRNRLNADDETKDADDLTADDDDAGFFPDLLRRGLSMGFTGLFMTEEAVRRALGDSVPRDVIEFFIAQSEKTRTELLERLSTEFGRTLQALDPVELARRLLDGATVEISAKVRFVPEKDEDPKGK